MLLVSKKCIMDGCKTPNLLFSTDNRIFKGSRWKFKSKTSLLDFPCFLRQTDSRPAEWRSTSTNSFSSSFRGNKFDLTETSRQPIKLREKEAGYDLSFCLCLPPLRTKRRHAARRLPLPEQRRPDRWPARRREAEHGASSSDKLPNPPPLRIASRGKTLFCSSTHERRRNARAAVRVLLARQWEDLRGKQPQQNQGGGINTSRSCRAAELRPHPPSAGRRSRSHSWKPTDRK